MKIWTRKELNRGYIPSDKIRVRGIPFEYITLSRFDKEHLNSDKIKKMVGNFRAVNRIDQLIDYVKFFIKRSQEYMDIVKEGYHTHLYLNINFDGIDCFISR